MRSGYQIVDFCGKSLSDAKVIIPGIYDKIEGSLKAILCKNVVIDSVEIKPFYAEPVVVDGDYVIPVNITVTDAKTLTATNITITDDDEVTVSDATINSYEEKQEG